MKKNRNIYLIDLDHCLYNTEDAPELIKTLEIRITNWFASRLGSSFEEAEKQKNELYKEFGGAPRCFIKASFIKNKKELISCVNFIHDFKVYGMSENFRLRQKLMGLDGDLYLFTSSFIGYAKQVLSALGVSDLFSDIMDISRVGYSFKNEMSTYIKVFDFLGINPNRIIMVDDSLENLTIANRMGIKSCILIDRVGKKSTPNFVKSIDNIMSL